MERLDIIIILTWFLFIIFFLDLFQRKRFNFLHFLIFAWGTWIVIFFILFPKYLEIFWKYFWVARGADLIVYMSIIFLTYLYIELVNSETKKDLQITELCTAFSLADDINSKPLKRVDDSSIGFLIRAYNEEEKIWLVIKEIVEAGYSMIVICDDWSTDKTKEIVKRIQNRYMNKANIVLLSHLINRWWWAANKTLFEYAKNNYSNLKIDRRVTYDADGQMSVNDMVHFEYAIRSNPSLDVIIGSRFVSWWKAENIPLLRKIILQWARVVTYIFNWIWLTDVSTWYRMYKSTILHKISLKSDWFTYQNDIVESMYRYRLSFKEIPVHISYTEYSLSKWQASSNAFTILKELFWKSRFYK